MSQKYSAPRGTQDVLPPESHIYQFIADTAHKVFQLYGYQEIKTPVFEHTELFVRGVGEATDVVSKEMYTFQDKKGRSLSLRPEGTAGAIRAYLEHNLGIQNPICKLYYIGPMFRYERPQAGRLRQHTQIGAECIGSANPSLDAEVIALFRALIHALGLMESTLLLNSLGDKNCRPVYKEKLHNYFKENLPKLCKDCNERFEKNPLRILDCKNDSCQTVIKNSPVMLDSLCADCKTHFESVKKLLSNLEIKYQIAPLLVRGLDYYTRTVFEFQVSGLGAQNAIGGGGRYDNLVEELGGPSTPALGFGSGIERLALTLQGHKIQFSETSKKPITLVAQGDLAINKAIIIAENLRQKGIAIELDHRFGSFKSQLKFADKLGSTQVLILGENELTKGVIQLKDMTTGEQKEIPIGQIISVLSSS